MQMLRLFLRDFWSDVIARLSGIASVVLALIAASRRNPLPNWAFWIAAAICFIMAAFRTWRIQYQIAAGLTVRLERLASVSVTSPSSALLEIDRPSSTYATIELYLKIPISISNPRDVPTTITLRDWHFKTPVCAGHPMFRIWCSAQSSQGAIAIKNLNP